MVLTSRLIRVSPSAGHDAQPMGLPCGHNAVSTCTRSALYFYSPTHIPCTPSSRPVSGRWVVLGPFQITVRWPHLEIHTPKGRDLGHASRWYAQDQPSTQPAADIEWQAGCPAHAEPMHEKHQAKPGMGMGYVIMTTCLLLFLGMKCWMPLPRRSSSSYARTYHMVGWSCCTDARAWGNRPSGGTLG